VTCTLRHSTITDRATGGLDLLTVAQLSVTSVEMIVRHDGRFRVDRAADALAKPALWRRLREASSWRLPDCPTARLPDCPTAGNRGRRDREGARKCLRGGSKTA